MAYTSHGHHIPKTVRDVDRPPFVARCGGVSFCSVCTRDAAAYLNNSSVQSEDQTLEDVAATIKEAADRVIAAFEPFIEAFKQATKAYSDAVIVHNPNETQENNNHGR